MHHTRAKGLCEPEAVVPRARNEKEAGTSEEKKEKREREREKLNIPGTSRDPGDRTGRVRRVSRREGPDYILNFALARLPAT